MSKPPAPPKLATRILELLLADDLREAFIGDLAEAYTRMEAARGRAAANRWYWSQAARAPLKRFVHPTPTTGRRTSTPRSSAMFSITSDIRLALRGFARRPGFSAIFVLTTALGIGAATAIFSAARPILIEPLPYANADRIVALNQTKAGVADSRIGFNTIADLRERVPSLSAIAAVGGWQAIVSGNGEAAQYAGLRVSPEYFSVLGVKPALGRDFRAEDDVPNSARMVILSDRIWREQYGADARVLDSTVKINDFPYTIIGVMPAGYEDVNAPAAQFWRPLQYSRTTNSACRSCQHLRAIGRLKDGAEVATAGAEVNGVLASLGPEFPNDYPKEVGGVATPLGEVLTQGVRPAMGAALAAVLLVLLIACVNGTNLLLGRAAERRAELAVRLALGAPRGRIVRQLLVESVILTGTGGVIGIALAWAGLGSLVALAPQSLPRAAAMVVNLPVLGVALFVTMVVGITFGLMPALEATRTSVHDGMQLASRRTVGRSRGLRAALVVSEVSLAVLVLTGSGLLLRSMNKVLDVDPGFEPRGLLTLQMNIVGQRFANDTIVRRYYDELLGAVRDVPGVESVAYTSQLPLSSDYDQAGVLSERHPAANRGDNPSAHRYGVSPGYLETMGIPVVKGRTLLATDDGSARDSVVLVNAAFAKEVFKGEDPIGQRIRINDLENGTWRTVVGVTGDIHQVTLTGETSPAVYVPELQLGYTDSPISLVMRTKREPTSIAGAVRAAIRRVDAAQPILRLSSMEAMVESSAAERRFILTLFEAFAVLSALLAALGMYGVLAASVAERVREIGVREALGATPGEIVAMVVRQAMTLVGAGALAGGVTSLFASAWLADQLFEVSRGDPLTYAVVFAALAVMGLVACAVPAARAARVDPMESLRAD